MMDISRLSSSGRRHAYGSWFMPRPLKRRRRPDPQPLTLRRFGSDEPGEVVTPDELERRQWQRELERIEEHRRLALRRGDTITVPDYTGELWWFVRDVNGLERDITAATLIFEQPRERTFSFEAVELLMLWHQWDYHEALRVFAKLERRLSSQPRADPARAA